MRRFAPIFASVTACAAAALILGSAATSSETAAQATSPAGKKTIGLVLSTWNPAVHQSADEKAECPDGIQDTNRANWNVQFATEEERNAIAKKYAYLGPNATSSVTTPTWYMLNRGPEGQNVLHNPTAVTDKLPFKEVQGKIGLGLNLDDDTTGDASVKTCKHENFTTPDGEPGIDNQLYRVYGCAHAWRQGARFSNVFLIEPSLNRLLVRITDVDDEMNDDHVEVTLMKGLDRIVIDAGGKALPWLTQRIDQRYSEQFGHTTGRIVNGTLETDPIDYKMPMNEHALETYRYIRGMRLKLNLKENSAEGLMAGYEDLTAWWQNFKTSFGYGVDTIGLWSPPGFYQAAVRNADGYPDPKTGQCTAISAAYKINLARAFIIEPSADDPAVRDPKMRILRYPVFAPKSAQNENAGVVEQAQE